MPSKPDSVMIFAAGFGTRMGALTQTRPKPLIEVLGRPLIDHALQIANGAGIENIVVNTHYRHDMLAHHLAGRNIRISHELKRILETGGGLRHALPLLGKGPVFSLNSDALWDGPNPLEALRAAWNPRRMDALLMLVPRARALGHKGKGDFLSEDEGRITRGPGHIFTGAQIMKTDLLADIPHESFSLNLVWDRMLARGRLFGLEYQGRWCDVGHPEALKRAEREFAHVAGGASNG